MYLLAEFDYKEYEGLIDRFSRSRKGIDNFCQELKTLKPKGFISDELKIKLDGWCETSLRGSYKRSRPIAKEIRERLFAPTSGGGVYVLDSIELPNLSLKLEDIFHMPCEYGSDWNANYGITKRRKLAMFRSFNGKYSCLNPRSETFLTFFSLANLDSWQQMKSLKEPIRPREEGYELSASFFNKMRENWSDLCSPKICNYRAKNLIPKLTDEMMRYSVFFFEVDIMSSEINPRGSKAFKELSFLNISDKRGWSEFDAFIFLPNVKRCVFIESKLGRDIDSEVKLNGKIKIFQITRAMESAYLFTHHPNSNFYGWEYDYLFICPRDKYKSGKTKYSELIPKIQDHNLTVLRDEYQTLEGMMDHEPVKVTLFENFLATHHDRIHLLFWDQLFGILEEIYPNFLTKYMDTLRLQDKSVYNIWCERLNLASIRYPR